VKRYRHYKKQGAIVLSCFGSVIEQDKYFELEKFVKESFPSYDIFTAFSSRMVIRLLEKEGKVYKNLPQTLADVDMLGYKNIVVSSINLFPTDEHEFSKNIVDGFASFSLANFRFTNAILTKTKESSLFLKSLDEKISKDDCANLYIIHGTPKLDTKGIDSISYADRFLSRINKNNYTCSLEGAFPFYAIKDALKAELKKDGVKKIQVVPMLLVSGNHYKKDMHEICEELSDLFETSIVPTITKDKKFNLIEMDGIRKIIKDEISESITKLGTI
jgi:sirohydrochlorin cobaltochelatase